MKLLYEELTKEIIGGLFEVHNELGPGFTEQIYHQATLHEMELRGLKTVTEKECVVKYKDREVGKYRTDIIIEDKVIIELKAVSDLNENHEAQLISYLKATGLKVGLLINFSKKRLEFKRFIYDELAEEFTKNRKQKYDLSAVSATSAVKEA